MNTAVLFVPAIALYFFAAIGIAPVQAEAVAALPSRSGAASGLLTALQMGAGALTVQAIGFAHDGTPGPMFAGLLACTTIALVLGRRPQRRPVPAGGAAPLQPVER